MKHFITRHRQALAVWGAFALIIIVGGAFRFQALDWDQGQWFHPDERAIITSVSNLNTVVTSGDPKDQYAPRRALSFPYNGLGFFIPNGSDIRPATSAEIQLYQDGGGANGSYKLPANVVPPDQSPPEKAINFWNAAYSPLNPHFFAYGTLPMYLIKLGGQVMSTVTGENWGDYGKLILVGRFWSVWWSLGTLTLVFLLGRRAFGPILGQRRGELIGLLAAAFMAVAVLDIQLAHYLAFDVPLTFFITLAVFAAIGHMRSGTRWSAVRVGLAVGLALACKISAAPIVLVAVVAALLYGLYGSAKFSNEAAGLPQTTLLQNERERYPTGALGRRLLGGTLVNLLLMGVAALAAWFVAMPYAFIDFASWSSRVIEEAGMSRGVVDIPYTRQYVGTVPFLYQTSNLVQWGLGWPLGLLVLAGLIFGLRRLVGRRYKAEILLFSWILPYIAVTFTAEVKFNRYLLPLLPFLVILAARLIIEKASNRQLLVSSRQSSVVSRQSSVVSSQFFPTNQAVVDEEQSRAQPSPTVPGMVDEEQSRAQPPPTMARAEIEEEEQSGATPIVNRKSQIVNPFLRPRSFLLGGLALVALGWAAVWALSFSQIYSQEHTMNQASRWMYQNMPNGASYTTEIWDEGMPRGVGGLNFGLKNWRNVPLDIYGDAPSDTKIDYFIEQFKQADYIVISSNRLYATMSKLPWRYPIQIRYYELLFGEKLGYKQVATFTDYPRLPLIGTEIKDDGADESFTVYDHPKVMIFKKTEQFSDDQYHGLFANAAKAAWIPKRYASPADLPEQNVRQGQGNLESATAGQVRYYDRKDGKKINNAKSLLLDQPVDRLPVVDDNGWFTFANEQQWLAVIIWFVLAQVLGIAGLPIILRVCRRLPDRGYILAKPVGGMLVALVIWLLVWTKQVMNTVSTAYVALALVLAGATWLWWRHHTEMWAWIKDHRRLILIEELVFAVAFAVWVLIRLGNPDLWHPFYGGEKPMEFAQLNAILRSPYFPPFDPWFSDGYINYYYYGQYMVATWIKLTGIDSGIAFNLALPLLYGFVCGGGFSLCYNLATKYRHRRGRETGEQTQRRIRGPVMAGLFGVVTFAVVGNFDGFVQVLQRFKPLVDLANSLKIYTAEPGGAEVSIKFDYFRSTRIIGGTNISEFPYFSFLYGDLHAHLINLPYTLVALSLALNLISADWSGYDETGRNVLRRAALRLSRLFDGTFMMPVLLAILIGFLAATNIWDLPTYFGLLTVAFFLGLFRRPPQPVATEAEAEKLRPRFMPLSHLLDLVMSGVVMGAILVLGYALYWNFFSHYQALYGEIATTRTRSPLLYWLVIFIMPLFFLTTYLVWNYAGWLRPKRGPKAALPPRPSPAPRYIDEEDELDDLDGLDEDEELAPTRTPTLQPRPGFKLRLGRAELAFSYSNSMSGTGADGGYNDGLGNGGSAPQPVPRPRSGLNLFALPWVVILCAGIVAFVMVGLVAPEQLVFVLGVLIALAALILLLIRSFDPDPAQAAIARQPQNLFLHLLIMTSLAVVAGVEAFYLVDDLSGSDALHRMNTMFKFYYQVWTMLSLGAAFAAYVLWTRWVSPSVNRYLQRVDRPNPVRVGRFIWVGFAAFLLAAVAVYPVLAAPGKWAERSSTPPLGPTLDGRAYFDNLHWVAGMPNMEPGKSFDMKYEAQSLHEFYDKITGTPVVLQASIWPYRGNGSWIAINTGLPVVLGWDHHETQQRYAPLVFARGEEGALVGCVRELYNTPDITHALQILNFYHVTYVHLGTIERDGSTRGTAAYVNGPDSTCLTSEMYNANPEGNYEPLMSEEGFDKFNKMVQLGLLQVAYQNPGVTVYKLTPKGEAGVVEGDPNSVSTNNPSTSSNDPKLNRLLAAVNRNPSDAQARYDLSQYYFIRKDYEKAVEQMRMVTELQPNQVNPYHVLGDIYFAQGDKDKALDAWKQPTLFAPTVPAGFNKYGIGLLGEARYDDAVAAFKKAVQLNPRFEEAYYHLGECYEALKRTDEAVQAYQQTANVATDRESFWAKRALQKAQALIGKR